VTTTPARTAARIERSASGSCGNGIASTTRSDRLGRGGGQLEPGAAGSTGLLGARVEADDLVAAARKRLQHRAADQTEAEDCDSIERGRHPMNV
jgi:hypothetical protein